MEPGAIVKGKKRRAEGPSQDGESEVLGQGKESLSKAEELQACLDDAGGSSGGLLVLRETLKKGKNMRAKNRHPLSPRRQKERDVHPNKNSGANTQKVIEQPSVIGRPQMSVTKLQKISGGCLDHGGLEKSALRRGCRLENKGVHPTPQSPLSKKRALLEAGDESSP